MDLLKSVQGQNLRLPHCNIGSRFTSISRHYDYIAPNRFGEALQAIEHELGWPRFRALGCNALSSFADRCG
jgi:hypothetical protein